MGCDIFGGNFEIVLVGEEVGSTEDLDLPAVSDDEVFGCNDFWFETLIET